MVKRGVATKRVFFYQPVFWKMSKVIVFFGHFFGNFWVMFKKHYKNRYFSTFLKAKKMKKWPFLMVNNWATCKVNNWATFGPLKNRQRGPVINFANFGFPFFFEQKICWNPYFYSVFLKNIFFKKTNVVQLLTLKWPKRGPVINSTAHISVLYMYTYIYISISIFYIYLYVYVVELKADPTFALLPVFCVKIWSKLFVFYFVCFRKSRSPCRKNRT